MRDHRDRVPHQMLRLTVKVRERLLLLGFTSWWQRVFCRHHPIIADIWTAAGELLLMGCCSSPSMFSGVMFSGVYSCFCNSSGELTENLQG